MSMDKSSSSQMLTIICSSRSDLPSLAYLLHMHFTFVLFSLQYTTY